jgi:hypothetical protein
MKPTASKYPRGNRFKLSFPLQWQARHWLVWTILLKNFCEFCLRKYLLGFRGLAIRRFVIDLALPPSRSVQDEN